MLDRLYAAENARLVAEQENEDLHRELDLVTTRVCLQLLMMILTVILGDVVLEMFRTYCIFSGFSCSAAISSTGLWHRFYNCYC